MTESNTENKWCHCVPILECLFDIVRALQLGSCLSLESRTPQPGSPMSTFGIRKRRSSEQSPGTQNSPFDYRKKERLHRIPGRLYLNGSSEVASLFTQQGKKGPNQDAMIVWEVQFLHLHLVMFYTFTLVMMFHEHQLCALCDWLIYKTMGKKVDHDRYYLDNSL